MIKRKKEKVIHNKRKVFVSLLILCIASIVSFIVMGFVSFFGDPDQRYEEVNKMLDNYIEYSDVVYDMMRSSYGIDFQKLAKSTALETSVLRRTEEEWSNNSKGSNVRLYKDGCLFRYDGKDVQLPAGLPTDLNAAAIHPENDRGVTTDYDSETKSGGDYAVAYSRIKDDLYYMEWAPLDEPDESDTDVDWDIFLESIIDTYRISVIETQENDTGDLIILGGSEEFATHSKTEEFGLTRKMVEDSMNKKNQLVRLNDESYFIQSKTHSMISEEDLPENESDETPDVILTALVPVDNVFESFGSTFAAFSAIMLIFGITLIVWLSLTYSAVASGTAGNINIEKLKPSDMKKKVIVYIILTTVIIGCCCAFFHALSNLFVESTHDSKALENITKSIDEGSRGSSLVWENSKNEYIDEAQRIAAILDDHPQLRNPEWLKEASGIIGADYIMLFDTNGDEILSDSRYRRLSLGQDESSATYDFRRLLKGVRNISHEKLKDEVTGLTRNMYGVSLKYVGREEGAYGALIIAVDPMTRTEADITEKLSDTNTMLSALSIGDYLSFAVDPESGKIRYSSEAELAGKDTDNLGLSKSSLRGSFMGFFEFDSTRRFGKSTEKDGLLYYYSSKQGRMFSGVGRFAEIGMIMYLIVISLIAYVLMHGYNNAVYEKMKSGERYKAAGHDWKAKYGNGKIFSSLGISGSPFRKAMMTMMILVAIALTITLFVALQSGRSSVNDSVITYIMNGDWDRGMNIFAMTAVFLIFCNAVLAMAILYAVRVILSSVLNARASTICSLITSVLQYLVAIIALFVALGYCGVDYKAILASVGIISMAVSFGAKDLVADIFAGFNILTNNSYQMGDIVEIAGYRGRVSEVSLRTTKLVGDGGNIKTIRNSTIGDVINLSAHNSIYTAEIVISIDNDLTEIEEMMKNELPEIGKRYPQFINGPVYKGVGSMGGGRETLLIQTECIQKDYSFVVSVVNKELQLMFKKYGIEML